MRQDWEIGNGNIQIGSANYKTKMGKGSKPRPVDKKKFDVNFDKIFRKKPLDAYGVNLKGKGKITSVN